MLHAIVNEQLKKILHKILFLKWRYQPDRKYVVYFAEKKQIIKLQRKTAQKLNNTVGRAPEAINPKNEKTLLNLSLNESRCSSIQK